MISHLHFKKQFLERGSVLLAASTEGLSFMPSTTSRGSEPPVIPVASVYISTDAHVNAHTCARINKHMHNFKVIKFLFKRM